MAGVLWTGIDLSMGAVLGPVIGGLDEETSASVFERLTPKLAFLLPSLALVTIAAGITLAGRQGWFENGEPWLALFTAANLIPALLLIAYRLDGWRDWRWQLPFAVATVGSLAWVGLTVGNIEPIDPAIVLALLIVTVLSVQGFGFMMPGEVRIYLEMVSAAPDPGVISRIGQQNAMLEAFRASANSWASSSWCISGTRDSRGGFRCSTLAQRFCSCVNNSQPWSARPSPR